MHIYTKRPNALFLRLVFFQDELLYRYDRLVRFLLVNVQRSFHILKVQIISLGLMTIFALIVQFFISQQWDLNFLYSGNETLIYQFIYWVMGITGGTIVFLGNGAGALVAWCSHFPRDFSHLRLYFLAFFLFVVAQMTYSFDLRYFSYSFIIYTSILFSISIFNTYVLLTTQSLEQHKKRLYTTARKTKRKIDMIKSDLKCQDKQQIVEQALRELGEELIQGRISVRQCESSQIWELIYRRYIKSGLCQCSCFSKTSMAKTLYCCVSTDISHIEGELSARERTIQFSIYIIGRLRGFEGTELSDSGVRWLVAAIMHKTFSHLKNEEASVIQGTYDGFYNQNGYLKLLVVILIEIEKLVFDQAINPIWEQVIRRYGPNLHECMDNADVELITVLFLDLWVPSNNRKRASTVLSNFRKGNRQSYYQAIINEKIITL